MQPGAVSGGLLGVASGPTLGLRVEQRVHGRGLRERLVEGRDVCDEGLLIGLVGVDIWGEIYSFKAVFDVLGLSNISFVHKNL